MKHIKLFESWVNEAFYLKGFKQNMKSKVEGNLDQYIDFDKDENLYFVNIPYDKIKGGVDDAEKIIKMYSDGRYPKCKVARLNADKQEIQLVFTNESKLSEAETVDVKAKYPEFVAALEKAKVPCKVKLMKDDTIAVECGWDYPDRIFDKVDDAATSVGLNTSSNVDVCAEQAGGTVIDSKRIAGGPKRY